MVRRIAVAVVGFGMLVGGAQTAVGASPKKVTVALPGAENNLTPFTLTFGSTPNTHDLINLVYDTLFWSQNDLNPEPWLADSAEASPDAKVWTVKLKSGIFWHDGVPFSADDVKFSFDYYDRFPGSSGRYAHHVNDVPLLDHAEVLDPQTVRFFYKQPAPTFRILPGADLPILPRHVWEGITEPSKATKMLPIGTGPFKVVEMVPDQLYRLVANDRYFKGRPTVDELDLPIVKDPTAAFASLRTGQVDNVALNVPPELVDQFSNSADVKIARGSKFESTQLYFNARKEPLSDAHLRKAISLAIDDQTLLNTVLLGHGRPGRDSFTHPDSPWALPGGGHEYDVNRARTVLDSAGYAAKDPDGVRKTAAGLRLEFTISVSSFAPQEIRAAQLIAEQVAPIGVHFRVEPLDPATLRQRRQGAPGQPAPYDAYISELESHGHVDPDALYYFFHSPGPKGFGAAITGYSNPKFDALAERASVTTDLAARKDLIHEEQRILSDDMPVVVLYYPDGLYGYRPATYDRWFSDPGHGIFTKRSFLAAYTGKGSASAPGSGGTGESPRKPWVIAGAILVVALTLGGLLLSRRRQGIREEE